MPAVDAYAAALVEAQEARQALEAMTGPELETVYCELLDRMVQLGRSQRETGRERPTPEHDALSMVSGTVASLVDQKSDISGSRSLQLYRQVQVSQEYTAEDLHFSRFQFLTQSHPLQDGML